MSQKQELTWIGLQVQDCIVDRLICDGVFSWVYGASRVDGHGVRAFKLAKPTEHVEPSKAKRETSAYARFTGGSYEQIPDTKALLKQQFEKLKESSEPDLVRVGTLFDSGGMTFYSMELLEGKNLRQLAAEGKVPIQSLISVCDAMARLAAEPEFAHHGDLKPENLVFIGSELKIIDPGFFGQLHDKDGRLSRMAVTTRIYYPSLQPDDIFAFGLMLWELACKAHPLADGTAYSGTREPTPIRELDKLIKRYKATGNAAFEPFATLRRPAHHNVPVPENLEAVILKCLGMRASNDQLETGEKFATFHEVSQALQNSGCDQV